jgi:hypothetical protein
VSREQSLEKEEVSFQKHIARASISAVPKSVMMRCRGQLKVSEHPARQWTEGREMLGSRKDKSRIPDEF